MTQCGRTSGKAMLGLVPQLLNPRGNILRDLARHVVASSHSTTVGCPPSLSRAQVGFTSLSFHAGKHNHSGNMSRTFAVEQWGNPTSELSWMQRQRVVAVGLSVFGRALQNCGGIRPPAIIAESTSWGEERA